MPWSESTMQRTSSPAGCPGAPLVPLVASPGGCAIDGRIARFIAARSAPQAASRWRWTARSASRRSGEAVGSWRGERGSWSRK